MTVRQDNEVTKALAKQVSDEERADIYSYFAPINGEGLERLQAATGDPTHARAILILNTEGGDGAAAYQIARHFHRNYERLTVYIPFSCASAGTFVALGAHDLIMDSSAIMGPIDPQIRKHDEISMRESALSSQAALRALGDAAYRIMEDTAVSLVTRSETAVSFKLASEVGANLATNLVSGLASKLDPTVFGTRQLAIDSAIEYGKRLIRVSNNASEDTVHHLVTAYPSHDFVIDFAEASELFRNVSEPSELLRLYAMNLYLPDGIAIVPDEPAERPDQEWGSSSDSDRPVEQSEALKAA